MNRSFFSSIKPSRMWHPAEIAEDARHAWQLLFNRRVPLALKLLLPLGALVYWFLPIDLIPMLPIDDIAILLLAMRLFVTLGEQATSGAGNVRTDHGIRNDDEQTVDATWRVVDDSGDRSD